MNDQMHIMISHHRQQIEESRSEYNKLQTAYNHLENEFRTIFKGRYQYLIIVAEKDKYDQISTAHFELQRMFNEQQQVQSRKLMVENFRIQEK